MGASRAGREGGAPRPTLRPSDAVALVLGIVIGAGIFRAPPAVAAGVSGGGALVWAWLLGGAIMMAGALCYAELATTYPHAGGDYHFLGRAFGRRTAFLFGWARLTVIPTGSVALLAFVFEDYARELLPASPPTGAVAAGMVVAVTLLNVAGLRLARWLQNALTAALVLALLALVAAGFLVEPAPAGGGAAGPPTSAFGLAMVFVLLTYGGWNEAAYVSAEVRGGRRALAGVLAASLAAVTALYVLTNAALLRGLGLRGMRESGAVAVDLLARALGDAASTAVAVVVLAAVLTSANATLLMGSRQVWAFGRDFPLFARLGRWSERAGTPVNALLVQGAIALALVAAGARSRSGFEAAVAYTAPVFWGFFLLSGLALFVLRRRDAAAERPFRAPLHPLPGLVFVGACLFLLWSSLAYAGAGALAGVAVVGAGLLPMWWSFRRAPLGRASVEQEVVP